jgi:hypothetical protein
MRVLAVNLPNGSCGKLSITGRRPQQEVIYPEVMEKEMAG